MELVEDHHGALIEALHDLGHRHDLPAVLVILVAH
jgi:hypothetical protein